MSLFVSDVVNTSFLTVSPSPHVSFLAAIDSTPFHLYTSDFMMQPPKKLLDYVRDSSSGVSNEVNE